MANFAEYYLNFLIHLGKNILNFFQNIIFAFSNIFKNDLPIYNKLFSSSIQNFNLADWIAFILITLINLVFIFFLCYWLCQIIRRYIIFRSKEVDIDEMMELIAKEKEKNAQLTVEKNELYALKINNVYQSNPEQSLGMNSNNNQAATASSSRFSRLSAIDKKYLENPSYIPITEYEMYDLEMIINTFINFAASQLKLYYTKDTIRRFFAGMAMTKVMLLEGISGTGKTSLPYALGKFFNNNATIISVQPSWRDRQDLIGYLNEFTKTFNETDFLSSVYDATYNERPTFIVLDEMNLARIEYYFAEFLSVMEMPDVSQWTIDVVSNVQEDDPTNLEDGHILVSQGIWFIGTANQDDSTFAITDKVYDRTATLDFNGKGVFFDAPLTESLNMSYSHLTSLFYQATKSYKVSQKNSDNLKLVDNYLLDNLGITFGNRILRQINTFIPVYVACGGTELEAIDFLLMSKILRKLSGLNLVVLKKELKGLITLLDKVFGKNNCPMCEEYINKLLKY